MPVASHVHEDHSSLYLVTLFWQREYTFSYSPILESAYPAGFSKRFSVSHFHCKFCISHRCWASTPNLPPVSDNTCYFSPQIVPETNCLGLQYSFWTNKTGYEIDVVKFFQPIYFALSCSHCLLDLAAGPNEVVQTVRVITTGQWTILPFWKRYQFYGNKVNELCSSVSHGICPNLIGDFLLAVISLSTKQNSQFLNGVDAHVR